MIEDWFFFKTNEMFAWNSTFERASFESSALDAELEYAYSQKNISIFYSPKSCWADLG